MLDGLRVGMRVVSLGPIVEVYNRGFGRQMDVWRLKADNLSTCVATAVRLRRRKTVATSLKTTFMLYSLVTNKVS